MTVACLWQMKSFYSNQTFLRQAAKLHIIYLSIATSRYIRFSSSLLQSSLRVPGILLFYMLHNSSHLSFKDWKNNTRFPILWHIFTIHYSLTKLLYYNNKLSGHPFFRIFRFLRILRTQPQILSVLKNDHQ